MKKETATVTLTAEQWILLLSALKVFSKKVSSQEILELLNELHFQLGLKEN